MILTPLDDPRLDFVYQGVQQMEDGTPFRTGVFKDGSLTYVNGTVSRTFHITEGSFEEHTKHVMVTYDGQAERLCREEFKN